MKSICKRSEEEFEQPNPYPYLRVYCPDCDKYIDENKLR